MRTNAKRMSSGEMLFLITLFTSNILRTLRILIIQICLAPKPCSPYEPLLLISHRPCLAPLLQLFLIASCPLGNTSKVSKSYRFVSKCRTKRVQHGLMMDSSKTKDDRVYKMLFVDMSLFTILSSYYVESCHLRHKSPDKSHCTLALWLAPAKGLVVKDFYRLTDQTKDVVRVRRRLSLCGHLMLPSPFSSAPCDNLRNRPSSYCLFRLLCSIRACAPHGHWAQWSGFAPQDCLLSVSSYPLFDHAHSFLVNYPW